MSLDQLPSDVLDTVLHSLDTSDLLAVCTTCKILNGVAESHLWRSINLLVPQTAPHGDEPSDEANLDWSRRRLAAILPTLDKRVSYVKIVKCQITRENWYDLAQLLLATRESLIDLRIQSCPFRQLWTWSDRTNAITLLFHFLIARKISFSSMRTLCLPLEHHYEALFTFLLQASPDLDYLLIDKPRRTQWYPDALDALPVLHHLTRFKVELLDRDHMPFVSHVLRSSPKLGTVSFKRALAALPSTTWWLNLRNDLAAMPRLHTLEIHKNLLRDYCPGGFGKLRHLKLHQEYRNCFSLSFSASPELHL